MDRTDTSLTGNMSDTFTSALTEHLHRSGLRRMEPQAALIDMDGTLYDSMPLHARAWQEMIATVGLTMEPAEFYLHEGRTGADTIGLLFRRYLGREATDEDCRRLYQIKSECFKRYDPAPVMPGAQRVIELMGEAGLKRVLVTGSGQSSLIMRLDDDYPGVFGLRVTAADVRLGKPRPEPYLKGAERAGADPRHCVVLENAPLGVESGHTAGCFVIGVNTGPIPRQVMLDAGADILFDSMPQAAEAMPELLRAMREVEV